MAGLAAATAVLWWEPLSAGLTRLEFAIAAVLPDSEWPLSETHADFIAAVPEPRGAPLAAALASLILIAWRGRRPQPPAGTVGSQKMR